MPGASASTKWPGIPARTSRAEVLRALRGLFVAGAVVLSTATATAAPDQVGVFVVGPAGDTPAATVEQPPEGTMPSETPTETDPPRGTLDLLAPETITTTGGTTAAPLSNLTVQQITPEQAAIEILRGWARGRFDIHFPKRFTRWLKLLRLLPYRLYFAAVSRFTGL